MISSRLPRLLWALVLFCSSLAIITPAKADDLAPRQILVLTSLPPEHMRLDSTYTATYGDDSGRAARRRLARQIARRNGLTLADDWPLPLLGLDCFVMAVPIDVPLENALRRVSADRQVAFAEPMQLYAAEGAAQPRSDPLLAAQPAPPGWELSALHQISTGNGVRVAIIDSAIDGSHPDLAGQVAVNENMVIGRAFVPERHGTAVAGVIAAKAGNGVGIAGVAPGARLMGLRACWSELGTTSTLCDTLSLAKALSYAVEHKAQVINMSLAGPPSGLLDRLITVALARRIGVVAAYDHRLANGGFPASHPGVVAVADLAARYPPGIYGAQARDVLTTLPGGRWGLVSGSSFAAANISGLLALVIAKRPAENPVLALAAVETNGRGVNACAVLLRGASRCACGCSGRDRAVARR